MNEETAKTLAAEAMVTPESGNDTPVVSSPLAARLRALPPSIVIGATICSLFVALALAPQLFAPHDPLAFDYAALLQAPSLRHPFGTDQFGRDMLSRTISATTIDLQIALFATLCPLIAGSLIGLVAGYVGGIGEALIGRLIDLVVTFPFFVLVIAIVAVLGPGLVNMYIAVSLVGWVNYTKLMGAEVRVLRGLDYVSAARALGYGSSRILLRHILPNAARPVVVYWMTDMALAILLGSSLGYLGLGAQPPAAEWGVLIADAKNYFTQAWWITVFPGAAIVLAGTGFSLIGDGLADLMDVRR
jgi:peptide/nickel transport system permease protein